MDPDPVYPGFGSVWPKKTEFDRILIRIQIRNTGFIGVVNKVAVRKYTFAGQIVAYLVK